MWLYTSHKSASNRSSRSTSDAPALGRVVLDQIQQEEEWHLMNAMSQFRERCALRHLMLRGTCRAHVSTLTPPSPLLLQASHGGQAVAEEAASCKSQPSQGQCATTSKKGAAADPCAASAICACLTVRSLGPRMELALVS